MEETLLKAVALLIILYVVYYLIRLIWNFIETDNRNEKEKKTRDG